MSKGKLVILRHGQTEYNAKKLMTGQRDVPLTSFGEEQARAIGSLIRHLKIDKAYSSTLSRAFNTAAAALDSSKTHLHLLNEDGTWQIEQREEIIEFDTGDFTGRCYKTDPEIKAFKRNFKDPIPGGESDKDFYERIEKFYKEDVLPRLTRGETVFIAAHSGVVRAFEYILALEEMTEKGLRGSKRPSILNASPHIYDYEDGVLVNSSVIVNPKAKGPVNDNKTEVVQKKKQGGPKF